MKFICVTLGGPSQNSSKQNAWLTVGKEYVGLDVTGRGSSIKYRLLGDNRFTPALHNTELFKMTSAKIPADWLFQIYPGTSEWVITPAAWTGESFWMAYFDGDAAAKSLFDSTVLAIEASS